MGKSSRPPPQRRKSLGKDSLNLRKTAFRGAAIEQKHLKIQNGDLFEAKNKAVAIYHNKATGLPTRRLFGSKGVA